jgi:ABC-type glycerol-3-phosphate transport system substrate-binding protein
MSSNNKGGKVRKIISACAALAALAVIAGAAYAAGGANGGNVTTLTLWHNYGTGGNAVATQKLVAAFEKQNPNIKINVVSQPGGNYFQLLQAAWIGHTDPDLSVQWTGLFDTKYESHLLNLKPYFTSAELDKINGAKWASSNFDPAQGLLVMPLENQFYMGFYNKALFRKAGVKSVPTDWSQLFAACTKLKAAGITPIVYGADPQAIGPNPYPYYDLSYIAAGIWTPAQLKGLYTGQAAWTSPALVRQVSTWASMPKHGCTNSDVLTKTNILGAFMKGQAAMIIDGNWDTATLRKALGANVAPILPPFTSKPQHGVVQYSGDGFAVSKDSSHQKEAVEFLKFLMTPTAQHIIAAAGLIPDIKGYAATNPLANQMLAFAKSGKTVYPMIDNVIQGDVVTTGMKQLDAALGGDTSAAAALKSMKQTHDSLPSDQRGSVYH